jgi:hypothetical protein
MKDFWAWASVHYFLAFILAWVALVIVGQVLTAFFRIFHRAPSRITLTDNQVQTLATRLKEPRKIEQLLDNSDGNSRRSASKSPTWYERLTK